MSEEVRDTMAVKARPGQIMAIAAGMGALPVCKCGRGCVHAHGKCRQCLDEKPAFTVTTPGGKNESPREATGKKPDCVRKMQRQEKPTTHGTATAPLCAPSVRRPT